MVLMSNLRTMNTYSDTFLIDKLYAEIDTIFLELDPIVSISAYIFD